MARGRMLSKDISLDEKVNALSDDTARLLFTWLIPHLDVEGRMYGDARLFISIIAPRRNYSPRKVEKYLTEMENLGLIVRYFTNSFPKQNGKNEQSISKNQYLFAPNFAKHQVGLRKDKEAQSQIPTPPTDLLRNKDGIKTDLRPPKRSRSIKEKKYKRKEVEVSTIAFDTYREKLKLKYPELNVDEEWESCQIWYRDNKKQIKSPSLALRNWMEKAREINHQGGQHGKRRVEEKRAIGMEGMNVL